MDDVNTMQTVARPMPEVRPSMVASLAENLAGGGAIALAIIGLAGVASTFVASIAIIAIGAAFLFEGGAISSRLRLYMHLKSKSAIDAGELGGGVSSEFFAGIAGLTLGILAIVNVVPISLIGIAVTVFGAAVLRGSRAVARVNTQLVMDSDESPEAKNVATELIMSSEGVQVLVGLAAVTLGIIAIIGIQPLILSLVALLIIGFSNLISGKAINGRMFGMLHQ
jgi:hypothetical protein